jgi:hypothetical protein
VLSAFLLFVCDLFVFAALARQHTCSERWERWRIRTSFRPIDFAAIAKKPPNRRIVIIRANVRSKTNAKRSRAVRLAMLHTLIEGDMDGRRIAFAVRHRKSGSQ